MKRWLGVFLFLVAAAARAEPPDRACSSGKRGLVECIRPTHFVRETCQAIEHISTWYGPDTGFFARLI
ncbi:hypothetical protein RXV86_01460 [Alisedimentitalea sp. MJ-SS2]|uniref:hypothetical protein n=1 Tax=Aliisedimentitalea sp. MJ-SS2 TaxID=3049795 RepID=UPI0029093BEE|nr:hypothetical protein [Alisedimentitalea sp. MJ-SS2]MDU8926043.1 hypothetical protein [Alisedimentitalea sp. MJ-SS2]